MSYTKQNFIDGQTLKAEHLNHMEEGIASVQYSGLKGKKISFVGDSITTFKGYIPAGYLDFYPHENSDIKTVEQTWWHQLITVSGMALHKNCAYAGSTVAGNSQGSAIVACSDRRVADIAKDGVAPDIIVVMMGVNDFNANTPAGTWEGGTLPAEGNITTFSEGYALLVKKIMTAYPLAELFISTVPECWGGGNDDNTLLAYNNAIRMVAESFGCQVIDMHGCGITYYNRTRFIPDGVHPNIAGARLLAKRALADISAKTIYLHDVPSDNGGNVPDVPDVPDVPVVPDEPTVEEVMLCGNLEDYTGTSNEFCNSTHAPIAVMTGYNADTRTTDLSGKTITKVQLRVKNNGTLTLGTCDLNDVDVKNCAFATQETFTVSGLVNEGDFVTIECNIKVGANETLAIRNSTDTVDCAISYAGKNGNTLTNVQAFRIVVGNAYGSFSQIGSSSYLCFLGGVWGYTTI